jgi:hypothetical protein
MGFLTYAIAIFVAPLAVALAVATTTPSLSASGGPSSLDFMAGYIVAAPMLWIVAAGLLTPMLLVCATCGAAWAGVLRRVFPRIPAPADGRRATWPGRVLLAILVALSVCWLGLAAILSSLQTEFVD